LLALRPDCLSYMSNSIWRELDAANDGCRFLGAGVDAVTASIFAWAYPPAVPPEFAHVHAACEKGRSSCYFSGSDPGWATTDLALAALQMAVHVECVRVCELGCWGNDQAEFVCREYFGFGQAPGFTPLLIRGGFLQPMWKPTLLTLCDAMGVAIEDWKVVYETDSLPHDVETGFGIVRAGTASVVHFELQAWNGGRPVAVVEHVDRVGHGAGPQWTKPHGPGVRLSHRGRGNAQLMGRARDGAQPEADPGDGPDGQRHARQEHRDAARQRDPRGVPSAAGLPSPRDIEHAITRNVRR
jgi:4-hydroxy-tetrahydrodipicolinate reductase